MTPPKLKISTFVLKRIEQIKSQCSGCLFGVMHQGTLLILGFNVEATNGGRSPNYRQIHNNFPTEVDLCGIIKFGLCTDSEAHLTEIFQDVDVTDNPILLTCSVGNVDNLKASLFKHGQLSDISFEILPEEELWRDFFVARLQCSLKVVCQPTIDSVASAMQSLRKSLASGTVAFTIVNSPVFVTGGNTGSNIAGIESSSTMEDLLNASRKVNHSSGDNSSSKSKRRPLAANTEYEVMGVRLLHKQTNEKSDENLKRGALKMTVDNSKSSNITEIPLEVDALSVLFNNTPGILLYDILVESIVRSLRLIEQNLISQLKHLDRLSVPRSYHFMPDDFGHFFTCIFPDDTNDDDSYLVQRRRKLHNHFSLPLIRPYFLRGNNYVFREDRQNKPLVNPHIGLKGQVSGGRQYLVHGKYSYHHYMQNGIDDSGWGCAYRSLQTICSWFRWQGYTVAPVPTHKSIQQYLVRIGDKPANFLNSKQWIGSMEVSMCLQEFVKVDSRIMNVRSGGELAEKGAELSMHFETQGTPIMIGGGVLAHTILGVDFNSDSGELKFLILDPHYTGAEDLAVIQAKGWCGWKPISFWDKKAYYNLCMPQRPRLF